ncbi:alpha/beta hydrolase, partial [Mesorhizobium sp. M7A.T.Ca.TU.009.01.1.2]
MSKTLFFAILASVAALVGCPGTTNAEETKPAMTTETNALPKPEKSGLLPINGLNYYYAIYGKGEPLLLLHGGLGTTD